MAFRILSYTFFFFTIASYGQSKSPELELEKKSLNLILNNFDSLKLINFVSFKKYNDAKVYYSFYVDKNSNGINTKIIDGIGKDFEIFSDSNTVKRRGELENINKNTCKSKKIKASPVAKRKSNSPKIEGDLFITIVNKLKVKNSYYVLVITNSTGSLVTSEILIKYDLDGKPLRVVTNQAEE